VQQGTVNSHTKINSLTPNTNTTTGTTTPSAGSGSAGLIGGVSQTFSTGSSIDPAASGTDNSAWSTANYPAQGTGNKTAGVRFNVSTVGRQNICMRWDQRESSSASKYVRLQYTTNGNDFVDFPTATSVAGTSFESKTNSLAGFTAVNDNPSFAFRIVSEFESSAAGTTNQNYVGASSSYGTAGTIRFDMVTIFGTITPTNAAPAAAVLTGPVYTTNFQFQFTVTGSAGSNYVVQASTNLSASNWISLRTNVSPFLFVETNANSFVKRFYRAFSLQ